MLTGKQHTWLTPIKLRGGGILPNRLMPGPMLGVMNPLFLRAMNELNLVDYWITPFVGLSTASPRLFILKKKLKPYIDSGKPYIVQFLGNRADVLADASNKLTQLNIAGINLNFACSSATVLKSGSGAGLLTQPEVMLEIINKIREVCPHISISLKLRVGGLSTDEIRSIIPLLCNSEVDFIMLHFRTALEKYKVVKNGSERIKLAVELASATSVPIIASGDIFSVGAAEEMYLNSKCHGITVARGLLKDPFLIRGIEAKLLNKQMILHEDPKLIFTHKLCEVAQKNPELYNRYSFLGLMCSIWGSEDSNFKNIIHLSDEKILSFFN